MDSDVLLKYFFKETYNDINIYNDYLCGKFLLDKTIYNKWLSNIDLRNNIFAQVLKNFDRIEWGATILESSLNKDHCVSKSFHNPSIISVNDFEKFEIKKHPVGDSKNHYICNGYYQDTLMQIYKVLDKGSFTVGISTYKNKELFDDIVNYYNKLKMYLLKNNYCTAAIQTYVAGSKVYLLMYDSEKQSRWKNDCSNNRTNWSR